MQETQVRSLIGEDPIGHGATEALHHNYRACALEPGAATTEARAAATAAHAPRAHSKRSHGDGRRCSAAAEQPLLLLLLRHFSHGLPSVGHTESDTTEATRQQQQQLEKSLRSNETQHSQNLNKENYYFLCGYHFYFFSFFFYFTILYSFCHTSI